MAFVKRTTAGAAALGMAILIGCGLSAPPARAAYTVALAQQGSDVVANGSGTLDLTGLRFAGSAGVSSSAMTPLIGYIVTGSTVSATSLYSGVSGPTGFGSGFLTDASSGTGDLVGIIGSAQELQVPAGFDSGSPVSDTATYANQTFSSLGATPGSYTWTWGSGTDDSFTVDIGPAAVPEPNSFALLALPLLVAARYRRPMRNI